MKPFCASIFPLLVTLVIACSNTQSPTSSATTSAGSASLAKAASGSVSVVTRTDEGDVGADGTVDRRIVTTTWYDVHDNVTKEVVETTLPPGEASRGTTAYQYNARGATLGYVSEFDDGADGTVDSRSTQQTVETDKQGNPIKQTVTYAGAFVSAYDLLNEFDARGRIIRSVLGPQTTTYGYDSHDNLVLYEQEISQDYAERTTTLEYNVHDAFLGEEQVLLFHDVEQVVLAISTLAVDAQGYPVEQLMEGNGFIGGLTRETSTITYDGRHNRLTQVNDIDYDGNGSIDARSVSRWEYQGRGDVPLRQANAMATALERGNAQTFSPSDPGSGTSTERGNKRGPVSSF